MKNERGITLASLVIYVVAMIIAITFMSSVVTNFYNNNSDLSIGMQEILNFNKFNTYFLKEVKKADNAVDKIDIEGENSYILFKSGNTFYHRNDKIYYNNIELCDKVKNLKFEFGMSLNDEGQGVEDQTIICVTLTFENISKTIKYKIENIY